MELIVGRVVKTHGLRGDLVVDVRTDSPDERFAPGSVLTARPPQARPGRRDVSTAPGPAANTATTAVPLRETYTVDSARWHAGRLLLRLVDVPDRTAAEALRGVQFLVDSDSLPPNDDPDEFHDHELIGLAVVLDDDTEGSVDALGHVVDIIHTPGDDLLVVRLALAAGTDREGKEVLVPFVAAIVTDVDRDEGLVYIDPPEGLFDL